MAAPALFALLALASCGSAGKKHAATSAPMTPPPATAATTTQPKPTASECPNPLSARDAAAVVRRQAGLRGPAGTPSAGRVLARWMPDTGGRANSRFHYDPALDLSAVVGNTNIISAPRQVFLFHKGCYLGTTTSEPRFVLAVEQTGGDTVVVRYKHYMPRDALCCPSLPDYVVRYRWNGSKVVPLNPIPPPDQGMSSASSGGKSPQPAPATTCAGHPPPFPGRPDPCHRSSANE